MQKTEQTSKKSYFKNFFYEKPQLKFNRNQFWILWTCRINTVKSVFVLFKKIPKHRSAGVSIQFMLNRIRFMLNRIQFMLNRIRFNKIIK